MPLGGTNAHAELPKLPRARARWARRRTIYPEAGVRQQPMPNRYQSHHVDVESGHI